MAAARPVSSVIHKPQSVMADLQDAGDPRFGSIISHAQNRLLDQLLIPDVGKQLVHSSKMATSEEIMK